MSKADAIILVGTLASAFPQATIPETTVALYAEKLADIPPDLLHATVHRLIESSRFFPTIGELRTCAGRLAGVLPASEAEALAIVRRADLSRPVYRRDGTLAYVEREWDWPRDVDPLTLDTIRDVLARVGEPKGSDDQAHFGWDTGFQKTYAQEAVNVSQGILSDLSQARLTGGDDAKQLGR